MLDPGSLAVLGGHFERLMGAIQGRVEQVSLVVVPLLFSYFDTLFFLSSFALYGVRFQNSHFSSFFFFLFL